MSPAEAARLLSCHRSQVYRLLSEGLITAKKMGRRTLIDVASLRAYVESLPTWS